MRSTGNSVLRTARRREKRQAAPVSCRDGSGTAREQSKPHAVLPAAEGEGPGRPGAIEDPTSAASAKERREAAGRGGE